jgi:hypothetical protein
MSNGEEAGLGLGLGLGLDLSQPSTDQNLCRSLQLKLPGSPG